MEKKIVIHKESKKILQDLYKSEQKIVTQNGQKLRISEKGSLGLLALGYKGIIEWRKARNIRIK